MENGGEQCSDRVPLLGARDSDTTSSASINAPADAPSAQATPPTSSSSGGNGNKKQRLFALDVFRGFTMVGMVMVDDQGSGTHIFSQLDHVPWFGVRFADFIYPWFIFIAGMSLPFAFSRRRLHQEGWLWPALKVCRRSVLLFAIGCFLNWTDECWIFWCFPFIASGILQRIAIAYWIVAMAWITVPDHAWLHWLVQAACLFFYTAVLYGVDVPDGCGRGKLTPDCNAIGWLNRTLFGGFVVHPTDPQGFIATSSACLTCFLGMQMSVVMFHLGRRKTALLLTWGGLGVLMVALGLALGLTGAQPLCKHLWTTSFVLLTAGAAYVIVAALYWFFDIFLVSKTHRDRDEAAQRHPSLSVVSAASVRQRLAALTWPEWCRKAVMPLVWLGSNPLLIFVFMVMLEIVLIKIPVGQHGHTLWTWHFHVFFHSWMPWTKLASSICAFAHLCLYTAIAGVCYYRGWFLKL